MPAAGSLALSYWRHLEGVLGSLRHQVIALARPRALMRLRERRDALRSELNELAEAYASVSPRPAVPKGPGFSRRLLSYDVGQCSLDFIPVVPVEWYQLLGIIALAWPTELAQR